MSGETGVLRWLDRIENALIAVLVLAMVLLAGAQILLRNLFETGIDWADPLLRATTSTSVSIWSRISCTGAQSACCA
jgi:TRAP-type C4-dicarboxylate transport system permease small subunit